MGEWGRARERSEESVWVCLPLFHTRLSPNNDNQQLLLTPAIREVATRVEAASWPKVSLALALQTGAGLCVCVYTER